MKPTTLIEQLFNYCNLHPNIKTKDVVEHIVASYHPKRTIQHCVVKWKNN